YWTQSQGRVSKALERIRRLVPLPTRGRSRMRESRTYGSGRGACDETHVPTATATRGHHAEAFSGRPLFTHALGHVGKHIELGHEHQPTFAPSPSALLKAGADRHCPPSSLPW